MNNKVYLLLLFLSFSLVIYGQGGVGINNTNSSPDPSAMLDVSSTDKGVLIPRFALNDVMNAAPVTSPAKGLLIFNDGGTAPEGFYYWDGTQWQSMTSSSSGGQVGAIVPFGAASLPTGFLPCDGSAVSRTVYADLFAVIGVTWGIGDGVNTFNLPDLRGRFMRGVDGGSGNDPDAAARTAFNSGNAGNNVGSYQLDAFQGHQHEFLPYINCSGPSQAGAGYVGVGAACFRPTNSIVSDGANGTPRVSSETRPQNANINFIIQYTPTSSGGGSNQTLSFASPILSISAGNSVDLSSLVVAQDTLSIIADADRDTKIQTEETADEDIIRFDIAGTERWTMLGSRLEAKNTGESLFIGEGAGANDDLTLNQNVFVGYMAGNSTSTGSLNTAVGYNALRTTATSTYNTALGAESLSNNTTGGGNVGLGARSLLSNTIGQYNIAAGTNALQSNTAGTGNSSLGSNTLQANTTGNYNVATGFESMFSNSTGSYNIGVGPATLYNNTTGGWNIAIGVNTLAGNSTTTENVGVGTDVLVNNNAWANTSVGSASMNSNTTGQWNAAFGRQVLFNNTTGFHNVGVGPHALHSNTTGSNNIGIGINANGLNQAGSNNTIVGFEAGLGSATHNKSGNVFLGYQAGYNEMTDNKLYIENSNSASPLIYGNFVTDFLQFNATVNINGSYNLPTTDGTAGQVLTTDGAGNASWQAVSGSAPAFSKVSGTSGAVTLNSNGAWNLFPDMTTTITLSKPSDVIINYNTVSNYAGNSIYYLVTVIRINGVDYNEFLQTTKDYNNGTILHSNNSATGIVSLPIGTHTIELFYVTTASPAITNDPSLWYSTRYLTARELK